MDWLGTLAGFPTITRRDVACSTQIPHATTGSISMNSFVLWATLGLVPFASVIGGSLNAGCP
ncbi:MAG: hypothetical protein ACKO3G_06475, partial [Planctomycetaceae bacterium]